MRGISFNNILVLIAIIVGVGIYIDIRRAGVLFGSDTVISRDTIVVNLPPQTLQLPPGQPINIINNPVPSDIDTGAILKAFFREVTYLDSIDNDTVKIVLKEIISENSVRSRELKWKLKVPISTTINTHEERKGQFYLGGIATARNGISLAPSIAYRNKKDYYIFGAYDPWERRIQAGYLIPLKK
jgi:hypothetical protein